MKEVVMTVRAIVEGVERLARVIASEGCVR